MIENGTHANQRTMSGTLASLPDPGADHPLSGPALVVIGEAIGLHATARLVGRAAAASPLAQTNFD